MATTMKTPYTALVTRGERFWLSTSRNRALHPGRNLSGPRIWRGSHLLGSEEAGEDHRSRIGHRAAQRRRSGTLRWPLRKPAGASQLQNEAALERRAAASAPRQRLTYTDIGIALRISYQRARQLVLEKLKKDS